MLLRASATLMSLCFMSSIVDASVCETKTFQGMTQDGLVCSVELETKVRAAQGGGSNSICVPSKGLKGSFNIVIDGESINEPFNSNAEFAGQTQRPRYDETRTEGYKYQDRVLVSQDRITVNKHIGIFEVVVTEEVGYTTVSFVKKIGEQETFFQTCLL